MSDPGTDAVKTAALNLLAEIRRMEKLFGPSDDWLEPAILCAMLDVRLAALQEMKSVFDSSEAK